MLLPKKWEVTQMKLDELNYVWTLNGVTPQRAPEICFNSHEFSSSQNSHQKWKLTVCSSTHDSQTVYKRQNGFLYQEFTFKKSQHNLNDDNELIISLKASLEYRNTRNFSSNECVITSPTARAKIQSQYKDQYLDFKRDHDLVLGTKSGQDITTSNSLLSVWSYVWQDRSFFERKLGPISFKEFDFEVVNETLHFLYNGEAPKMAKMAKELFVVAKKFQLKDLKKLAEEEICSKLYLDMDDIVKNLAFAHKNEAFSVKSRIINYVASQSVQFFDNFSSRLLKESHPELIQDILNVRAGLQVE
ncbi:hypothetical protein QAD02_010108 [Eretmocerus hayati]|uniref:Uncharacterized protein n=1 Tax=Eretmocerus hayati TaxID=131215 RepID=A0ACC2NFT1_9HYME|nr:hypothetical protein QAD02_010108 [Eretmocerus hayati]